MFHAYLSANASEKFVSGENGITSNFRTPEGALHVEVYQDEKTGGSKAEVTFFNHKNGTRTVIYNGFLGQA